MDFWQLLWSYLKDTVLGPYVWNSQKLDHRRELQWWNPFAWIAILILLGTFFNWVF